jgi:hypothetical protein
MRPAFGNYMAEQSDQACGDAGLPFTVRLSNQTDQISHHNTPQHDLAPSNLQFAGSERHDNE